MAAVSRYMPYPATTRTKTSPVTDKTLRYRKFSLLHYFQWCKVAVLVTDDHGLVCRCYCGQFSDEDIPAERGLPPPVPVVRHVGRQGPDGNRGWHGMWVEREHGYGHGSRTLIDGVPVLSGIPHQNPPPNLPCLVASENHGASREPVLDRY